MNLSFSARARLLGAGAGVVIAVPTLVVAAGPMQEGNWEVTTKTEMVGVPFAMPAQTLNQCVTNKDVVPNMNQRDQNCTVLEQKITGDTVTWRQQCKGKDGLMEGQGKIKYSGKTYDGEILAKQSDKSGEVMQMKMTMKGKFTGPCKAEPAKAKKPGDY